MHRRSTMVILFLFLILAGCSKDKKDQLDLQEIQAVEEEQTKEEEQIFVYVCGAVKQEGVYELPAMSRVYEAIEKAGGFSEDAATTQINQAEVLKDETRVYIPTVSEAILEQSKEDGKISINTGTKEELMTLPGVGESKANLIIQYRQEQGNFQKIEDIMNISGIKEGLFSKIKDYIKI